MLTSFIQKRALFLTPQKPLILYRRSKQLIFKSLSLLYVFIAFSCFSTCCLVEATSSQQAFAVQQQDAIPQLNLQEFLSSNDQKQQDFVDQFGHALNTYGFVLITNHGISREKIDEAYAAAKDFFQLPLENKKNYLNVQLNRGYRSYEPNRQDKKSDLQEYWHVGAQLTVKRSIKFDVPKITQNVWPKEIPTFRRKLTSLYREIAKKAQPLLEACSLYMGKERKFLSEQTRFGDSIMRVIHYLPNETSDREWKAPHRDPNLLTVIVGASMQGLELQLRDGSWMSVPYVPEAIIVSASNMLESLSNGLIRSAPHRVVIPEVNISRYSIPFFFHVQRNFSIAPQAECISKTGGEPLYPNQTAEEALKDHHWFPSDNK